MDNGMGASAGLLSIFGVSSSPFFLHPFLFDAFLSSVLIFFFGRLFLHGRNFALRIGISHGITPNVAGDLLGSLLSDIQLTSSGKPDTG